MARQWRHQTGITYIHTHLSTVTITNCQLQIDMDCQLHTYIKSTESVEFNSCMPPCRNVYWLWLIVQLFIVGRLLMLTCLLLSDVLFYLKSTKDAPSWLLFPYIFKVASKVHIVHLYVSYYYENRNWIFKNVPVVVNICKNSLHAW